MQPVEGSSPAQPESVAEATPQPNAPSGAPPPIGWITPIEASSQPARSGLAKWGRAVAIAATPPALLLVVLRYRVLAGAAETAADQGYVFGRLILGPLVLGAIAWGLIVLIARRNNPSARFMAPGLVGTIAVVTILVVFSSFRG